VLKHRLSVPAAACSAADRAEAAATLARWDEYVADARQMAAEEHSLPQRHAEIDSTLALVDCKQGRTAHPCPGRHPRHLNNVNLRPGLLAIFAGHVRKGIMQRSFWSGLLLPAALLSVAAPSSAGRYTYWTANRAIRYQHVYLASVRMPDCALKEDEALTAELSSAAGTCHMDLLAHTRTGVCDPALHAGARVVAAPLPGAMPPQFTRSSDPRIAKMQEQAQKFMSSGGPTGQKKSVNGIACEVWAMPGGGSQCAARGGSFTPSLYFAQIPGVGLVVEGDVGGGQVVRA
jgi:hypothetical protein